MPRLLIAVHLHPERPCHFSRADDRRPLRVSGQLDGLHTRRSLKVQAHLFPFALSRRGGGVQDEPGDLGRPSPVPPEHSKDIDRPFHGRERLRGSTDPRRVSRIE